MTWLAGYAIFRGNPREGCSPALREPFKRRCVLVPAIGFVEWKKLGAKDQAAPGRTITDGNPASIMLTVDSN
jgi:hypothetical protein